METSVRPEKVFLVIKIGEALAIWKLPFVTERPFIIAGLPAHYAFSAVVLAPICQVIS
jgi:hypothetical protein